MCACVCEGRGEGMGSCVWQKKLCVSDSVLHVGACLHATCHLQDMPPGCFFVKDSSHFSIAIEAWYCINQNVSCGLNAFFAGMLTVQCVYVCVCVCV